MDEDSIGLRHSRAERFVRNLDETPDRWHYDGRSIYTIKDGQVSEIPFGIEGAGDIRVWASEDEEENIGLLSMFLNPNDTERMPLEEDGINSQYRVAISLTPDYIIGDDEGMALQDAVQFLMVLAANGYDPTTVQVMLDTQFNEIDMVGMSDFDYDQMVTLHTDITNLMDESPLPGYVYALFTAPGIAEDFYPMKYGYPAARQAMLARQFESESGSLIRESAVRYPSKGGIVERVQSLQSALEASEMQERLIRVQYGIKYGMIQSPEEAMAILAGMDSFGSESTDACPLCQSPSEEWEDSFVCRECDRTICSGCDAADEDPICPECEAMENWDLPLPESLKAPRFDEGTWFLDDAYNIFPWEVLDNSKHGFWNSRNYGRPIRNLDWRDLLAGERGDDEEIDLRAIIPVDWPGDLIGSETFTSTTDPDRKINLNLGDPPFGDFGPTPVLVRVKKGGNREESYLDRGYLPFGSNAPLVEVLDEHRTPGDTELCLYVSVNGEIFHSRATVDEDGYVIYEAEPSHPCPACKEPAESWEGSDRCVGCDKTVCSGCIEDSGKCIECDQKPTDCDSNFDRVIEEIRAGLPRGAHWEEDEARENIMEHTGDLVDAMIADAINSGYFDEGGHGSLGVIELDPLPPGCITDASYNSDYSDLEQHHLNMIRDYCNAHGEDTQTWLEYGCTIYANDRPVYFFPNRDRIACDWWDGAEGDIRDLLPDVGITIEGEDDVFEAPRGRPKGSGAGNYTCGRCGKSGHNARTCDQPAPPKIIKPQPQSEGMVRCSNCDERGHNKTKCPHPERIVRVEPHILSDFEKWSSGESKMQLAGRVKRNIRRLLAHESGIGAHQLVSRYHDNLGTTSKTRSEVTRVTRIANAMPDVIVWRDGYYLLGSGGKEEFFKTGPGSLRG